MLLGVKKSRTSLASGVADSKNSEPVIRKLDLRLWALLVFALLIIRQSLFAMMTTTSK